jgi:hypothetical protein
MQRRGAAALFGVVGKAEETGRYFGVEPSWRVAPEGQPLTARRCSCPQPLLEHRDDLTLCVICGREPSIRLRPAKEIPRKMGPTPKGPASEARLEGVLPSSPVGIPGHHMERQFIFRTDEDLARALAEACRREERTFSSLIRFALKKHLNESAQPVEAGRSQSPGSGPPR